MNNLFNQAEIWGIMNFFSTCTKICSFRTMQIVFLLMLFCLKGFCQSCLDVSSVTLSSQYTANSHSQRLSTISFPNTQFLLCGPNTVVIDTNWSMESSCTRSVLVSAGGQLVIRSLSTFCNPPSVYVKNTGSVNILANSGPVNLFVETGAQILDPSNKAIVTTTPCIIFPLTECLKVGFNSNYAFQNRISCFPNPVTDNLIFKIKEGSPLDFISYTISKETGQLFYEEKITEFSWKLSTAFLSPGVYFIKLNTQGGYVIKKFVKIDQ